jgi:hypothetical protein
MDFLQSAAFSLKRNKTLWPGVKKQNGDPRYALQGKYQWLWGIGNTGWPRHICQIGCADTSAVAAISAGALARGKRLQTFYFADRKISLAIQAKAHFSVSGRKCFAAVYSPSVDIPDGWHQQNLVYHDARDLLLLPGILIETAELLAVDGRIIVSYDYDARHLFLDAIAETCVSQDWTFDCVPLAGETLALIRP